MVVSVGPYTFHTLAPLATSFSFNSSRIASTAQISALRCPAASHTAGPRVACICVGRVSAIILERRSLLAGLCSMSTYTLARHIKLKVTDIKTVGGQRKDTASEKPIYRRCSPKFTRWSATTRPWLPVNRCIERTHLSLLLLLRHGLGSAPSSPVFVSDMISLSGDVITVTVFLTTTSTRRRVSNHIDTLLRITRINRN